MYKKLCRPIRRTSREKQALNSCRFDIANLVLASAVGRNSASSTGAARSDSIDFPNLEFLNSSAIFEAARKTYGFD